MTWGHEQPKVPLWGEGRGRRGSPKSYARPAPWCDPRGFCRACCQGKSAVSNKRLLLVKAPARSRVEIRPKSIAPGHAGYSGP